MRRVLTWPSDVRQSGCGVSIVMCGSCPSRAPKATGTIVGMTRPPAPCRGCPPDDSWRRSPGMGPPRRGSGDEVSSVTRRGKGTPHHNPSMNPITQEQREAFARLLVEAKQRRRKLFDHQLEDKVREEFLPRLVQRQGIAGLVGKIGKLSSEL